MRWPEPLTAIHTALACGMLWLAGILAAPGDTFGSGRGWNKFAELGSEGHWSIVFMVLAAAGFVGAATSARALRLGSTILVSTGFLIVAGLMFWGSPAGSGSGIYTLQSLLGGYLTIMRMQTEAAR